MKNMAYTCGLTKMLLRVTGSISLPLIKQVSLGNTSIKAVNGLNNSIKVDMTLKGDIIDVCVDNRRCIVNRTPEQKGSFLWLYAKHGKVKFKSIKVYPII